MEFTKREMKQFPGSKIGRLGNSPQAPGHL